MTANESPTVNNVTDKRPKAATVTPKTGTSLKRKKPERCDEHLWGNRALMGAYLIPLTSTVTTERGATI